MLGGLRHGFERLGAKGLALVAIGAIALGAYAFSPAIGGGLFTKKKAATLILRP